MSNAINPNAANIRAALKAAGLEDALRKITIGPKTAYLYVSDNPQTVMAVVKTLSLLWNDSAQRILQSPAYGETVAVARGERVSAAKIEISRRDWEQTQPVGQLDTERRARALSGPSCDTEGYPLQYLPRRKGDHEPWAANERTKIRYGNAWIEEWTPVRDPQAAQDEAEAFNAKQPRRVSTSKADAYAQKMAVPFEQDSERKFRTKPGEHVIGRLVARSKCRRNRRHR